jgi:hypothetical protein
MSQITNSARGAPLALMNTRSFEAISPGRAVELVELLISGRSDQEVDALIELLAGVSDEQGDGARHLSAVTAIRHAHALRDDSWLQVVAEIQAKHSPLSIAHGGRSR